jgi:hypothetical protein
MARSWRVALIDQTTGLVAASQLPDIAAAVQRQVDHDLAPAWGVRARISVLEPTDPVPADTWPLRIVDDLEGAGGVHLDDHGKPYAEAVNGTQLSVAVSHELLEMLVDPRGDRFILADSPASEPQPHQVFYLVEIADPCEIFTYDVRGIAVSDFILPAFYNPTLDGPPDITGALAGPLEVPAGCFISWLDPIDGCWHQQGPDGTVVVYEYIPGPSPRAERDASLGENDPQRHNLTAITQRDFSQAGQ